MVVDNISSPLISFAGSGVAGFFMGWALRKILKILLLVIGSFLGAVFLVIQYMKAHNYIHGEIDWTHIGNDTMNWFNSATAQVSSSHIFGTLGIPVTSGLGVGLIAGLATRW